MIQLKGWLDPNSDFKKGRIRIRLNIQFKNYVGWIWFFSRVISGSGKTPTGSAVLITSITFTYTRSSNALKESKLFD